MSGHNRKRRGEKKRSGRLYESEKKRNARYTQKERENVASTESRSNSERSVHPLSDQRLKATLNEMNASLRVSCALA